MLSSLLSIPLRLGAWLDSPGAGMCASTSCTDDVPIVVSLAANSASTSAASDGRSRFLTARFWFAQLAASSPEHKLFDFCKELLAEFGGGVQS
jgi:hypothetical protein